MSYRRSSWFAVSLLLATSVPGFAIVYLTDAIPAGNTLLSGGVSNWLLPGANPFTITGVDLLPTDAIEDGTQASTMFRVVTDGGDDLAISVRSTAGDFRFLSATATVTFDEPPPPPDGKSPSLLRHSSSERVWRGLA